jgi:hypothetical protein
MVGNSARKFGGEIAGHCCIGQPGQLSMDLAPAGMGIMDLCFIRNGYIPFRA